MKNYDIADDGGGGARPEVVRGALKLLNAAAQQFALKLSHTNCGIGGERCLRAGEILPDNALADLRKFPAIPLGAIGRPDAKPAILEQGILLRARKAISYQSTDPGL
jgi:3-isopropylmalate dehydrogenase